MLVAITLLISCAPALHAALLQPWQRRRVVAAGVGALGAEAAGRLALSSAAAAAVDGAAVDGGAAAVLDGAAVDGVSGGGGLLPPGTIEQIESGRVVVLRDWLPKDLLALLRTDAEQSFAAGHYKADALAAYGQKTKAGTNAGFDPANDRMVMPSFFPSKGTDGPWVDPSLGDSQARARCNAPELECSCMCDACICTAWRAYAWYADAWYAYPRQARARFKAMCMHCCMYMHAYPRQARARFKRRMIEVRSLLARELQERPTLVVEGSQTHEMSYSRYGPGASLPRHTDEHHNELKKASGAAAKPTRRSVTWLVYLNSDWDVKADGGELRVHERAKPPAERVGARGRDLHSIHSTCIAYMIHMQTHMQQSHAYIHMRAFICQARAAATSRSDGCGRRRSRASCRLTTPYNPLQPLTTPYTYYRRAAGVPRRPATRQRQLLPLCAAGGRRHPARPIRQALRRHSRTVPRWWRLLCA